MGAFFVSPIIQRVLDALPSSTARVLETCLEDSAAIASDPVGAVNAHVEQLKVAAKGNEFLDLEQAEQLGRRCHALLAQIGPGCLEAHRKLVLAAVYYFILDDDAESDSDSVLGLEDDEQVLNAVEDELKRTS